MTITNVRRSIAAPRHTVFAAVADAELLSEVNPAVVRVDFLGDQRSGIGTRFRETRRVGRREHATELEVTEFVPGERVRMVADSHGTVWDTLFTLEERDGRTELDLTMEARAHKLLPKLMNPLMKGLIRHGIVKHVDAVQAFCEGRPVETTPAQPPPPRP